MKRWMLLSLILLLAVPAFAQGPAFQATSLPRQIRGEGITETVGDVVLLSTSAATIKAGSTINIVYAGSVTASPTVATLVVSNQNLGAGVPLLACTAAVAGAPVGCNYFVTISGAQVTIQFLADWNILQYQGLGVNNIRMDASAFAGGQQVTAFISGVSSFPSTNPITFTNPSVVVGLVSKPSLTAAQVSAKSTSPFSSAPVALLTCNPNTPAGTTTTTRVKVTEAFPAALTSLADETAFTANIVPTSGSIIQVVVHNVPTGASVVLTPFLAGTGSAAVTGALPALGVATQLAQVVASSSTYTTSTNVGIAAIAAILGGGFNTASTGTKAAGADVTFYVIVQGDSTATLEDLVIDFAISNAAALSPLTSPPLNITVDLSLIPGPATGTGLSPVVRFATTLLTAAPLTQGSYNNCTSLLMFPYVAGNVAGFDTSVAIANTTLDVLATAFKATAQGGTCTLTGYPLTWTADATTGAITAITAGTAVTMTTVSIPAGGTWAASLGSTTAFSGFVGYIFAQCQFLNAHGFAFITNGFGGTLSISHGYLPLVVNPNATRVMPAGEGLNN